MSKPIIVEKFTNKAYRDELVARGRARAGDEDTVDTSAAPVIRCHFITRITFRICGDIPRAVRVLARRDTEVWDERGVDVALLHGGSKDGREGGGGENSDSGELHYGDDVVKRV